MRRFCLDWAHFQNILKRYILEKINHPKVKILIPFETIYDKNKINFKLYGLQRLLNGISWRMIIWNIFRFKPSTFCTFTTNEIVLCDSLKTKVAS